MDAALARQDVPPASTSLPLLSGPLGQTLWRGSQLAHSAQPGHASGFAALDAVLPGGGWPGHGVTEILQPQSGVCEFRLLGPSLRGLLAGGRQLLLLNPPSTPHLPGLDAWGVLPEQLIWLAPATPVEALWALEQVLKSRAAAGVLAWLPDGTRPEQLRRLQACALGASAPCFLFRHARFASQSSAAPLRLHLRPCETWELEISLLKRRGPALAAPLRLQAIPPALAPLLAARLLHATPRAAPATVAPTAPEHATTTGPEDALARPAPQVLDL